MAGTQAAVNGLAGRKGAVVAIEPQTGKVRVMVSIPEYDPNLIPSRLPGAQHRPRQAAPQPDHPGALSARLDLQGRDRDGRARHRQVHPRPVIDGSSPRTISGAPLSNSGGENFGPISLTDALTNSVNTVFAQVGEKIGRAPSSST